MTEDIKKLVNEVSGCMKLLEMAIQKYEVHINHPEIVTKESQDEISGLMLGARSCTLSHLREYDKSIKIGKII